ncbi:MAG: hypothetical protein AUG51_17160 [Acidobacteria bacterium 13_1_20CM_3_53_8]|nr:MAG: hypothetical protein AUG51_17160 [Acidobacteria bacterium 13_1_20CM_3_53_8]
MIKIIEARALSPYRLYVKFSDGEEGEIDLSALAGQGVFAAWNDPEFFKRVHISSTGRSLEWGNLIDLCADSLYMSLTGQSPQELFPKLAHEGMRA